MDGDASAPLWILVVAPLLSGAFGAVAVALLTARHERIESHRDRMITAADDCIAALNTYMAAVAAVELAPGSQRDESLSAARIAGNDAVGKLVRVKLLYGPRTVVGESAASLGDAITELQGEISGFTVDARAAYEKLVELGALFEDEFVARAHEAVRPRWYQSV